MPAKPGDEKDPAPISDAGLRGLAAICRGRWGQGGRNSSLRVDYDSKMSRGSSTNLIHRILPRHSRIQRKKAPLIAGPFTSRSFRRVFLINLRRRA